MGALRLLLMDVVGLLHRLWLNEVVGAVSGAKSTAMPPCAEAARCSCSTWSCGASSSGSMMRAQLGPLLRRKDSANPKQQPGVGLLQIRTSLSDLIDLRQSLYTVHRIGTQ